MLKVKPLGAGAAAALALMRKHHVLGAAPAAELQDMLARSQVVDAAERDVLFHQGDSGRSAAVVLSGFVNCPRRRRAGGRSCWRYAGLAACSASWRC